MRDRGDVLMEQPWAMVDVELLVSSGAPREVFHLHGHVPGRLPSWRLDVDALRRLGWTVDESSISPPPSEDHGPRVVVNHPYALGSAWRGVNRWEAEFRLDTGVGVVAVVTHELLTEAGEHPDVGSSLRSLSPWVWWIRGWPDGTRAGRDESPMLAAAAAERLLMAEGVAMPEPTAALRRLEGTPVREPDGE